MKFIKSIDSLIEKICSTVLVVAILLILFFSSASIILRWFHVNLMWVDPFVRHMVFFATFLGGVIATGRGTHIGIDLVSKIIEMKGWVTAHKNINRIIYFSSFLAMVWLFKSSIDFTKVEFEFAKIEFLGISSGYLVSMIPVGVALIGIRYLAMFINTFSSDYRPHNVHTNQGQA